MRNSTLLARILCVLVLTFALGLSTTFARQGGTTIAPGGSATISPTTGTVIVALAWEVLDTSGDVLASNNSPNGWSVQHQAGGPPYSITVCVPPNATAETGLTAIVANWFESGPDTGQAVTFNVGTPTGSPPSAPTLSATASNQAVALSWTAPSGAVAYDVYQLNPVTAQFGLIAEGITATTYSVTGLTNGTTYYFYVTALNAAGASPPQQHGQRHPARIAAFGADKPDGDGRSATGQSKLDGQHRRR